MQASALWANGVVEKFNLRQFQPQRWNSDQFRVVLARTRLVDRMIAACDSVNVVMESSCPCAAPTMQAPDAADHTGPAT